MNNILITFFISTLLALSPIQLAKAQVGNNQGLLNPNRDAAEKLVTVPGISDDIAEEIISNRPYLDMLALEKVLSQHLDLDARKIVFTKLFVPLNLNTASREEILLVPNLGNKMAHEFEEYRPYIKMAQFRREMGKYVDDEEVARLEQFVFVPIELNTASKEDILSIPGVGDRMLHEFEEYRPYKSMEQFHREIGKYVDDKELARLARYVYLK